MKIYLATWLVDPTLGRSLTKKRANTRLVSFFFIKQQKTSNAALQQYSETGRCNLKDFPK
jgi:hypothetical protein